ncbi:MAG TPA: hypothetical protein VMT10_14645 [Solirubrobacteraceae bacterium]|nr:hypothetical protein [Solirubrobacteraceae bacterium]
MAETTEHTTAETEAPPEHAEPPSPPKRPPDEPKTARTMRFPSAFTVLVIVAVIVWVIALIIPSGQYRTTKDGAPIPHTYHHVPKPLTFGQSVNNLMLAPVNGLYGIKDAKTGQVSADASGELYGAAEVFLFVLAIGAFITVMMATGALGHGIERLAFNTRKKGWLLIFSIMLVFSILGSVEGFAEETLGFYGLIVPLMLALGYDRMVAVGTIIVGAGVGVMGATVNPFSIGIASGFANIGIGDGFGLRLIMWVVLTAVAIWYVLRYARRVRADPSKSLVGISPDDRQPLAAEPPALTSRDKLLLYLIALTFAFMIFSIMPWSGIFSGPNAAPYSWELDWWFPELTVLFLVATVVLGIVGGLREAELSQQIAKGAGDFIYPALVIVLARGVTVIMNNTETTDTVLHACEKFVTGASAGAFAIGIFIVNLPLAFLIPSTSGHATLAMPIMAPLASFANVDKSLVVTAWNAASGWMNLWVPTTAVVMGGLALAKVGYDKYLRFLWPFLAITFVLICAFLWIGAAIG